MKIRCDFVTNSSSSSFIIARKENLSKHQKQELLDYVIERFLSGKRIASIEELNQYAEDNGWFYNGELDEYYQTNYNKMKKAIESGLVVYTDTVSFEECEYGLAEIYEKIWGIMDANQEMGSFIAIDDDLSY